MIFDKAKLYVPSLDLLFFDNRPERYCCHGHLNPPRHAEYQRRGNSTRTRKIITPETCHINGLLHSSSAGNQGYSHGQYFCPSLFVLGC